MMSKLPTERSDCWPSHYPPSRVKLEEITTGDINLDEVHQHNTLNDFWVTFAGDVYDISKMTSKNKDLHKKLLFAGGQDLEPLYNLFSGHYRSQMHDLPFIRNYKIGHLSSSCKSIVKNENKERMEKNKSTMIDARNPLWKNRFFFREQFGSIL
eukprot:UN01333